MGGDLKAKRLKELTTNMPSSASSLQDLRSKGKEVTAVAAKVISIIDRGNEIPVMFVCSDVIGEFFVLSVYNAEPAKIAEHITPLQTTLTVAKPHYRQIRINADAGSELTYPTIRVAHPVDISIVGGQNLSTAAVKPAFSSQ